MYDVDADVGVDEHVNDDDDEVLMMLDDEM